MMIPFTIGLSFFLLQLFTKYGQRKSQPLLPQAGTEAGPRKESLCLAATVEEPRKQRTARVDWAT